MYDSIQAVLTSQLRYRALWNESTATKTAMSYQSRIVYQSTVIGVRPWGRGRDRAEITRASRGRLGPYPRIPACESRHWHISSARDRPKGPSRRARRPAAHRLKKNPSAVGAPKPTLGGFWRGMTRQYRANRVISQTVPHPYMMLMLGRGQWARQGSMRSDAGVSGVRVRATN